MPLCLYYTDIRNRFPNLCHTKPIRLFLTIIVSLLTANISIAQPIKQVPDPKLLRQETTLRLPPKSKKNAQTNTSTPNRQPSDRPTDTRKSTSKPTKNISYINIENADSWSYNQELNADAQVLVGNVTFSHDGVFLYCDSAYFYEKSNSFDAYGNVLIRQGDTLFVYADELYYSGNTKLARLRYNVLMDNLTATLRTDSLNYDRVKNVGYYFDGGVIQDSLNVLSSQTGHYYPSDNIAIFRNKVQLVNNRFIMNSDTLRYNTKSKIVHIIGPTNIVYEKKTTIYSEYGWDNTQNEQSKLLLNSYIVHQDGKRLEGDTIFYDKKNGKGECFGNVHLIDTKNKVSLNGNYGYYIEKGQRGVVTDSAVMVEYSSQDTLFLHADTIRTFAKRVEIDAIDSLRTFKDSVYNVFDGFYNVRFFRSNMQGVCDSMNFDTRDSILVLMNTPVLWADYRQISGDTIKVFQKNEKVDHIVATGKAFVTDSVEKKYFNQLSGKQIVAVVRNDSLRRIDVLGNAQSIYFVVDSKDSTLIGMASTESSLMNIYITKKNSLDRIVVKPKPTGVVDPIDKIDTTKIYLANYSWRIKLRPSSKRDIFRKTKDSIVSKDKKRDKKGKKDSDDTTQATTSTTKVRPSGFDNPDMGEPSVKKTKKKSNKRKKR